MSAEVFIWMLVFSIALAGAIGLIFFRRTNSCTFKIFSPYLTCWKWYLSQERPYTQKIYKMALQIDITNIADHRCMIRDIELFVITKGDKYSLPLQENGNKLKNIEIRARAVVQKNLQVAFEHIEQLPVFFPNEEFNFYLSYKENRKKAETTRIQRINFIISTPEKA